jgi:hypothetical protein
MTRLGLHLTLRSGREAFVRLVITALAVALGVAVLLGVFAEFHAFQVTSNRPSWESTGPRRQASGSASREELWNYSESLYQGRFVETLLVAPLGPHAPVVPGIANLPPAGQFYASPALEQLLRTVPVDQLGARFPGTYGGTIGQSALSNPDELVAIVGMTRDQLASLPNTITVSQITSTPASQGTTNVYRLAFGLGAIAVLFPLLILISTATRLSAARREERYAAIRLVGGTQRQMGVVASVDAVIGAFLGTLLGIGLFLAVRPFVAHLALSGARFFPSYVTPTIWAYIGLIVLVPAAAAISSLVSLRRVQISPLGVARKTTPPAPRAWRVIPLLVGIPLFLIPVLMNRKHPQQISGGPLFLGMLLIMVGLVLGGSWLTWQGARAMARWSRGSAGLLASRRLEDDPKRAFRSVSGLVLAVFVGTAIAMVAPALNAAQSPTSAQSLTNVLRVQYSSSFSPKTTHTIVDQLEAIPGARVLPIYLNPDIRPQGSPSPNGPSGPPGNPGSNADYDSVLPCAALRSLPALGRCPAGARTAFANAFGLFTDNPLYVYRNLPLVRPAGPAATFDPARLSLGALLVRTNGAATLERVRTALTRIDESIPMGVKGESSLVQWQMGGLAPETFGEVAQIRNNDDANLEHVILALLGLTLLVAGCSLAVAVGGSLVERKRPFTLLRVSGTPESSLRRVVLLEAALPLLGAAVIAALVGAFIARPFIEALSSFSRYPIHVPYPSPVYFVTMAAGLLASLAVVLATLPLLGRITRPDAVRFE